MKALIDFSSFESDTQKRAAWHCIVRIAEDCNWDITSLQRESGSKVTWTPEAPYLLADTVAKTVQWAIGSEPYDNSYDAMTQFSTIFNAIRNNKRTVVQYGDYTCSFDANGDVYFNKLKIPSATFDNIIAARTAAMS